MKKTTKVLIRDRNEIANQFEEFGAISGYTLNVNESEWLWAVQSVMKSNTNMHSIGMWKG